MSFKVARQYDVVLQKLCYAIDLVEFPSNARSNASIFRRLVHSVVISMLPLGYDRRGDYAFARAYEIGFLPFCIMSSSISILSCPQKGSSWKT